MSSKKTISNSFNVNTIQDGESPYFADLDNEMDSVLCNASGYTTSEQALNTTVNFSKGITSLKPYTSISCSIEGVTLGTSYVEEASPRSTFKASVNLNTGAIVITVRNNKSVDKVVVNIAVVASGQTQNLSFTINGVRPGANGIDGDDAVILSLVPNVNEIVKKKDGSYSPSANTYITCAVKKRVGNGTISDAPSSEYTLKYILNETGGEQTYSSTAIKASDVTKNVVFILYDKAGTPNVLDRETVGLITDGDDVAIALVSPDKISVPCNANGRVAAALSADIELSLKVGTHNATVSSVTYGTLPTGVTIQGRYTNAFTINIGTTATASGLANGITFTVNGYYPNNTKTYSATVTIALIGALRGSVGRMGRFPYFAAIWNNQDSTQLFTADDTKAPFFAVLENGQYHYYVYKGETNFSDKSMNWLYSNLQGDPSSSNPYYEIMYDDFSYIITKCIFGEYAHFGASIINGDFLISQYGYMRGFGEEHVSITDGSQYMNMEANDPYGEGDLFNDQTKFLFSNGSMSVEVDETKWWEVQTINKTLSANKYYTIMCVGDAESASGSDTLKVKVTANSTDIAEGQAYVSTYGGECVLLFKPTVNATITVKAMSTSDRIEITGLYVREAQFVPNVCIDMLRGKLAANDIIARGKLCMDSAYYENNIMLYNDRRITVKNESFICLSDQASNTDVVLPSPSSCQGRQIEIFSMSPSWTLRWSGATWNDYFLNPYDSNGTPPAMKQWGNGNGTSLESHTQYLRLYSNGSAWVVLCVNWGYTQ